MSVKCQAMTSNKTICYHKIYMCKKCKSSGCDNESCPNKAFFFNQCLRCGINSHSNKEELK